MTTLAVAALLLCAGVPAGDDVAPLNVEVGFAGRYKLGVWSPVRLTLGDALRGADARQLTLVAPDADGGPMSRTVALDPSAFVGGTVDALVRIGRPAGSLRVELRTDDRLVASRDVDFGPVGLPAPLDTARALVVVVGEDPLGIAAALGEGQSPARPAVATLAADRLPTDWAAYEGVAWVVVAEAASLADRPPSAAQIAALDRWVSSGGSLLLNGGGLRSAAAGRGSRAPFDRLLPGEIAGDVPLRTTTALESYAESHAPIPLVEHGGELAALRLARPRGIVEAREADLPLVVRAARGLGQVVWLAVDLRAAPLAAWPARGQLVRRLLGHPARESDVAERAAIEPRYGVVDVAGQLRKAINRFPGVRAVPFWQVAALVALYLLVVGPVDYWLVHRVFRRPALTWVTLALTAAAFTAGGYLLMRAMRGDAIRCHLAEVVDLDVAGGEVRLTSWIDVYSPRTAALTVDAEAVFGPPPSPALLAWLGLPGDVLGGMASTVVAASWPQAYHARPGRLAGLPVRSGDSRSLTARWQGPGGPTAGALVDDGYVLTGRVQNPLDAALTECIVAHQGYAYQLGDLAPRATAELGPAIRRGELRAWLTGRQMVYDAATTAFQASQAAYDRDSTDVAYILRQLMFHEAAGGIAHAGLANGYQSFVDLSHLLPTDRAILVGFVAKDSAAARGIAYRIDGVPMEPAAITTAVRAVYAVVPRSSSR